MNKFKESLESVFKNNQDTSVAVGVGIGMGILIGAMAGFDMGGPINKIAFLTSTALIQQNIFEPMGMMAAAIPVAPLGMALCTFIFQKKFSENEKTMGLNAFLMGLVGISEGAIPFAVSDPKRAIFANVLGSAIAGAIAGALGVTDAAAHGGPIVAVLGAVSSSREYGLVGGIAFFFLAIIIGTLVTCFVYGFLRKTSSVGDAEKTAENAKNKKQKISFKLLKRNKNINFYKNNLDQLGKIKYAKNY